jgi:hypothetical protein
MYDAFDGFRIHACMVQEHLRGIAFRVLAEAAAHQKRFDMIVMPWMVSFGFAVLMGLQACRGVWPAADSGCASCCSCIYGVLSCAVQPLTPRSGCALFLAVDILIAGAGKYTHHATTVVASG